MGFARWPHLRLPTSRACSGKQAAVPAGRGTPYARRVSHSHSFIGSGRAHDNLPSRSDAHPHGTIDGARGSPTTAATKTKGHRAHVP